jgi:hypothetical protein
LVPELEAAICTVEVPAGVTLEGLVGAVGGAVDWDAELPPPHAIIRPDPASNASRTGK